MTDIATLLDGFKRFKAKHFVEDVTLYKDLAKGQAPKTLVIACSDSRVDPSILLDAQPGDIFVIRNVANLVPPYQPENDTYHGTSAALEFAVNHLKIENILILGHSNCAGVKALVDSNDEPQSDVFSFIHSWVHIAKEAKTRAIRIVEKQETGDDLQQCCAKQAIITSLANLQTFPWVADKVANGQVSLHGWFFSLTDGVLQVLDENNGFQKVD